MVVMAAMHTANTSWNVNSRMALVFAVVEQGTFAIDGYEGDQEIFPTSDKAAFGGHFYSDKAFGVSLLCVPVYAAMQAIARLFDFRWDLQVTIYLLRMVSASIPAAISLSILWLLLVRAGAMPRRALVASALAFFGSIWFGYSTLAMPYSPGIASCLAATYLLCHPPADGLRPGRAAAIGFLCGFAVICDFLFGPIAVAAIAAVFLIRLPWARRDRWPALMGSAVVAGALPLALFAAYSYSIFGTLSLPYQYRSPPAVQGRDVEGSDGHDTSTAELCVVPHLPSVSRCVLLVALDSHGAGWLRPWHAEHGQSTGVWMDGAVGVHLGAAHEQQLLHVVGRVQHGRAVDAADAGRGAARAW